MSTNDDIWRDYNEHQDDAEDADEAVEGIIETLEYDDYAEGYTPEQVESFRAWAANNIADLRKRFAYWDDDDDEEEDEEDYAAWR